MTTRGRTWAIALAILFGLGLALAGVATSGAPHLASKTGASERPTPQPPVNRTYGEDAYGSGVYGR